MPEQDAASAAHRYDAAGNSPQIAADGVEAAEALAASESTNPPASPASAHPAFDAFVSTIAALRAPGGCPWDRSQTHATIAHNMLEEAYEAVDAIEHDDMAHLREELGDVLLQVVLQAQIAADAGEFTIDDVCADINAKMIRRHPHVFGESEAADANDVMGIWEKVKLAEKEAADAKAADAGQRPAGLLDGVPSGFPALMQAQKISKKAVAVGFEWDTIDDIWDKVDEERTELMAAYAAAPKSANGKLLSPERADDTLIPPDPRVEAAQMELGDVLFCLVNVARRMGIDAENALRATCVKFRRRWACVEEGARLQGCSVEELTQAQMEELWQAAKQDEHGGASPAGSTVG